MHYGGYPWAFAYGLYYYILFQLIYVGRYGTFNFSFNLVDLSLAVVGIASVLILMFFWKKLPSKRGLLLNPFVAALPFSVVGALVGGSFGWIGTAIFGLAPFVLLLAIGYWLIKKLGAKRQIAVSSTP